MRCGARVYDQQLKWHLKKIFGDQHSVFGTG